MLKMFDYIFYRIASIFREISIVGDLNAIGIKSIAETFYLLTILAVIDAFFLEIKISISLTLIFLIIIVFHILNGIRYFKIKKFPELDKIWSDEDKRKRKKRGILIIIYLLGSIILPTIIFNL